MSAGSPKRKSVFQGNVRMCMTWSGDTFFFIVVHIYDMSRRGRESGLHRKSILQFLGMLYLVCLILKAGSGREAEEADGAITAGVEKPKIAITFDDGPHPVWTPKLLEGLKEREVLATFFLIGSNIDGNETVVKEMYENGHIVGNHTFHHVEMTKLSDEKAMEEIRMTNEKISAITGEPVSFMRPPFGAWQKGLEKEMQVLPVNWSVDTLDWTTKNADEIVNKVVTEVKENDIILMHDCYESSVNAALRIVDILKESGYEFVTVEELILP